MIRTLSHAFLAVVAVAAASSAQDGPLQRAGQAIDNAGRNIRNRVENDIERGQINAYERDLLARVSFRLSWDKQLANSAMQLVVQPDGTAILRGSVLSESAKKRAVDLTENTVGVTRVVDELAIVKDVRVIQPPTQPGSAGAIISTPPAPAPGEVKVIVKP